MRRAIDAVSGPPRTVPTGSPLHEVARLLANDGVRAVVVVDDDGTPAGIVTERDLVVRLVDSGRLVGIVARDDLADEAAAGVLTTLGACPSCGGPWLRPVSTAEATNFLCLCCRSCWHLSGGAFARVETRTCPGCPEHNFCRFPLIDYGVDPTRLPPGLLAPRS